VLVGDAEGVVVIPRRLAGEVARQATEQEHREAFLLEKIRGGAGIVGVYPADQKTLAEYESYKRSAMGGK
jgi:regulator of RNase E activity RraA